jgi:hypothetical protein
VPATPNGVLSLRLGIDPGTGVPVAAWSLSTAIGVILFAAFLGRPAPARTPHGAASVAVLSAVSTASPPIVAPVAGLGRPTDEAEARGDVMNQDEANLPRWLRPTLREQRHSGDPGMLAGARQPARFAAPPQAGVERRTVAYRLVRLSDGPDDATSNEVDRLDRGDEVEVIGEQEGFLLVRTPTGLEGWVPRVVLVG